MSRKLITNLQVVQACAAFHDGETKFAPWEALTRMTGQPEKVVLSAMDRAEKAGLIESGVSTRTAWPTDKGRLLLAMNTETK